MANALYPTFLGALGRGEIDLESDTLQIILVDTDDYTYDDAHDTLSDVPAGARVATGTLSSVTWSADGTLDAADPTLSAVTGDVSEAFIIYDQTADQLIAYIDTDGASSAISFTPNGGDLTVELNANGIFSL